MSAPISPRSGRPRDEQPLDDVRRELEAHIDLAVQELVQAGWAPDAARAEALRRFGDFERTAARASEAARAAERAGGRERGLEALAQDCRYGLRSFGRSPGFALVAVLTLGLGIGANTAVFSVVNGVLLRPLPYPDPDRLVAVAEVNTRGGTMQVAWPNLVDWTEQASSFAGLAGYAPRPTPVIGGAAPARVTLVPVTREFWSVFPVRPELGRLTTPEDHRLGAPPVVVVSHRYWTTELGAAPDALGRTLEVSGLTPEVVGVLPAGFDFPGDADLWMPTEITSAGDSRSAHNWLVVGRLAAAASAEAADRELDAITTRVLAGSTEDPDYLAADTRVTPYLERLVGASRRPLGLLLGAAALVLLVACTNLASTLLARGSVRATEMAVRASLGAGRGRLVRQLLTESLLLGVMGALTGVALAALALRTLVALGPASVPRLDQVGLDPRVLAFTFALALGTVVLFGLVPALRLSRGVAPALRGGRGNTAGGGAVWSVLVGTEVALALLLLAGSGLLIRSFWQVVREDAGFERASVLAGEVTPSRLKYPDAAAVAAAFERLIDELEADPAIERVGLTTAVPMKGSPPNGRMELDDDLSKLADGEYVLTSDGYFEAMGIPLLQGRAFSAQDAGADHVAIVSRSFAERYWPGEDPIGRRVTGGGMDDHWQTRTFATVIGVVGDVRYRSLVREPYPVVYFSLRQRPFRAQWGASLIVRGAGAPAETGAAYRRVLARVDPDVPVVIQTMDEAIGASLAERRFTMTVLGTFAGLALLLALIGIYGVVSYAVARRTKEMGIRLALGARSGLVVAVVVRHAMRAVVAGLLVGAAAALTLGRVLEGLLYEVEPTDPATLIVVVAGLGVAALLASWIPARRTARIDPIIAMRAE